MNKRCVVLFVGLLLVLTFILGCPNIKPETIEAPEPEPAKTEPSGEEPNEVEAVEPEPEANMPEPNVVESPIESCKARAGSWLIRPRPSANLRQMCRVAKSPWL